MERTNENATLERVEVRIELLRQDSRQTTYRIEALEDRRKEIQTEIKALKMLARQLNNRENETD